MNKIHWIIDIISLFEAPNTIEEPKEVLTFNLCQFAIECAKVDVIFISVARNSRNKQVYLTTCTCS